MKILIIGSGISGLASAIKAAEADLEVVLVSSYQSERAQSVMAAGGINAVLPYNECEDDFTIHIEDTLKGGCNIAGKETVAGLCNEAPKIIEWLESLGVVFSRDEKGRVSTRNFGGQSKKRTAYAGSSTGKQIVTALVSRARQLEIEGKITRLVGLNFHSALIKENVVYGAMFVDIKTSELVSIFSDVVVMATGGQNALFGKTTGSALNDGYAVGRLLLQGAVLKNLEFIQYHPTTIETSQKRMLITEAARGEGGRLYYLKDGKPYYFMEEMYGENGNLMPRDVVSRCIYSAPSKVYLDITFLGEKLIKERLYEVYDLCKTYLNLDVTKESIPVAPSVHFFMGGLAVDKNHRTSIKNMYAVGECASIYHGANRLGGNSLLAAIYSGIVATRDVANVDAKRIATMYSSNQELAAKAEKEYRNLIEKCEDISSFYNESLESREILDKLAVIMNERLGIVRTKEELLDGLDEIYALMKKEESRQIRIEVILELSRAILRCACDRQESRGSHYRKDYPEVDDNMGKSTFIKYIEGQDFGLGIGFDPNSEWDTMYECEDDIIYE